MRAEHDGWPIAKMLNEGGISAFVLNYRVSPYRYPAELYDIQRAVRLVRYRADEFGIDPDKIGVLGFSAGGHLATMGITQYDEGLEDGDYVMVLCDSDDENVGKVLLYIPAKISGDKVTLEYDKVVFNK